MTALFTLAAVAASFSGSPAIDCSNKAFGEQLRQTYRYSHINGDYRTKPVYKTNVKRLTALKKCSSGEVRQSRKRSVDRRVRAYKFHVKVDQATPYGKFAVPGYIVWRESRGNRCAKNKRSTAGGYYQFIDKSWYAYGGHGDHGGPHYHGYRHPAACAPDAMQHLTAARAVRESGLTPWALTR